MINFETTIGIEIHTELKTKTKLFSTSKNDFHSLPNINIQPYDLAFPGTLPVTNKKAVELAIILASELNMNIAHTLTFDRKHYFYHDLPKGYQITQQYNPIGTDGHLNISNKKIGIERIHLEEDTAKSNKIANKILINYNRAGVPLIEIVSKPDISSSEEAAEYIKEIKNILTFKEISDAKMEEGSLRCDINISITPYGSDSLGTRVEIKNINSVNYVVKAIEYEISRQKKIILSGNKVNQETRRWDETTKKTIFMRNKEDGIDYRYITESNLPPFKISKDFVDLSIQNSSKSYFKVKEELRDAELSENDISILINDYELYKKYNYVYNNTKDSKLSFSYVCIELVGQVKKSNLVTENWMLDRVIEIINLIKSSEINGKQAKSLLEKSIINSNKSIRNLIEELGFVQIKDEKVIHDLLLELINSNLDILKDWANRRERVLKYYIGMLMKKTSGQANPTVADKVLLNMLKEKFNLS